MKSISCCCRRCCCNWWWWWCSRRRRCCCCCWWWWRWWWSRRRRCCCCWWWWWRWWIKLKNSLKRFVTTRGLDLESAPGLNPVQVGDRITNKCPGWNVIYSESSESSRKLWILTCVVFWFLSLGCLSAVKYFYDLYDKTISSSKLLILNN